ncbi:hypothetical protein ACHWQZ_G010974 [Mnemiopsis leidyi]
MKQKVQLTLSCTGLRDADIFSKSDPLVTVFDDFNNELGRTECIDNELNPNFKEKITLEYDPYEEQKLIFKVWDIDDYENDINKADFLGEMHCTIEELVDSPKFSKALRYEGTDYGKIFIKSEKLNPPQRTGKKGKKGKKGAAQKKNTKEIKNDTWIKSEMTEVDDTFKSCGNINEVGEQNSEDHETEESLGIGPSDTMMTQGFVPSAERYTPTHEHESKFTPIEHPLRQATGNGGYLSDPGINDSNEQFKSLNGSGNNSKPYHFIPTKSSLYDMSLTPLEEISCITPHSADPSTLKLKRESDTFSQLTGEYLIKEEDTYEELKQGYTGLYPAPSLVTTGLTHAGAAMTHAGTAMTPAPPRVTVNAGTSPIWRNDSPNRQNRNLSPNNNMYSNNNMFSNYNNNNYNNNNNSRYSVTSRNEVTSPPAHPPSIHSAPSSELRWCKYSSKDSSLWESSDTEQDKTEFYSFTDTNRQVAPSPSRRPPILEDFERTWENVLIEGNSPDWSAVDSQQWRTWFEFYKATRKVKKLSWLLVGTMMGTREVVQRGSYVNSANKVVHLPAAPSQLFIEDKSILHQPPPLRFNKTDINVINVDPIQVCLHLQKSGYKPGLFVPANPHQLGGEWRTGGIGPLEEFIRRSSYYTCVDDVDGPVKSHKRTGSMGLLGPTECQVNTNVTVFRESQQRNYLFLDQPQLVDVFSISPLPKVKRQKENINLTNEEVHLLKRKLNILLCTAAAHGADCLVITPHLTEGRRVPHRHVAQIVQSVVTKYNGLLKRVIVAIERDIIFHDISKDVLSVYSKQFPEGEISLPSLPPLPSSQEIVMWHWMGDNDNWCPYDPKQNEVIDAIYLRGECKMSLKAADSSHPGYTVDFNHFNVKSLSSGSSRKIGRFKLVYDKIVKKSSSRPVGNWVSAVEETNKMFETAGEETLQLSQPVPVWQWLNDDNKWEEYGAQQTNKLESAYLQHGTACVILHINEIKFSVNTKSRIQTNTSTGKQRKVQRSVRSVAVSPPPRASSTPTPPSIKSRPSFIRPTGIWEHQGADKSWLPFDSSTSELMEAAYSENKLRLTVVFNNQAYWIYFDPYFVLVDPNINEEYAIRRVESREKNIKPVTLFQQPVTPNLPAKKPVTPMSNSTMIEHVVQGSTEVTEPSALFTTASEFTGDETKPEIPKMAPQRQTVRQRSASEEGAKYDANQNRMVKTFLRHPGVQANVANSSLLRDPSREFSWEWEDRRTGLWHSLPEFISCFLEPASKTQSHGGVRTSKLTDGSTQILVKADFDTNTITGHLPGKPEIVTRLRRVEVCSRFS